MEGGGIRFFNTLKEAEYEMRDAITAFLNAKWLENHKGARDFLSRMERCTGISFEEAQEFISWLRDE